MPSDSQGGDTALIRAAEGGRIECVCLLLERGVEKEAVNNVRFLNSFADSCLSRFLILNTTFFLFSLKFLHHD